MLALFAVLNFFVFSCTEDQDEETVEKIKADLNIIYEPSSATEAGFGEDHVP